MLVVTRRPIDQVPQRGSGRLHCQSIRARPERWHARLVQSLTDLFSSGFFPLPLVSK